MIYPRRRLLIWFAAAVLPCAAVSGLPAVGPAAVASGALLVLTLAADGLLAAFRAVELRVEADPVVRIARGQRGHIRMRIAARRSGMRTLHEAGLEAVSKGVTSPEEIARVITKDDR